MNTVRVKLAGERGYDILIGAGLLDQAHHMIMARLKHRRTCIVHDHAVSGEAKALAAHLESEGCGDIDDKVRMRGLIEGEEAKSWKELQATVEWLLERQVTRDTIVVAMGGGVTGDHAGFAAAITLRGLDYVQIPTTLLAQVDSSVGGKTGINSPCGKNLIGAFHQPRLVIIDTDVLSALPYRHLQAGYAEIIKYALIKDPDFFHWLDANGAKVIARDKDALIEAITHSCQMKAGIVAADEKEANIRALLNFGHTFAHVLEAACNYDRRLLHGEAVSIGMCLAFDVSVRSKLCPPPDMERVITHFKRLGLPTRISDVGGFPDIGTEELISMMYSDKKVKGGKLTFIMTRGVGKAFVTQDVDLDIVRDALSLSMEG